MTRVRTSLFLGLLVAVPVLALGCGKAAQDPQVLKRNDELAEIYEAYNDFSKRNQRPPKQLADFKELEAVYPLGIKSLKDGRYVAVWNVNLSGKDSNKVVAYEKDAPANGGWVLTADGKPREMSADELKAALK